LLVGGTPKSCHQLAGIDTGEFHADLVVDSGDFLLFGDDFGLSSPDIGLARFLS